MTLVNVPFTKADMASHVLLMFPNQWQDHYNLHKKSMTPMDMHSLLTSLEAIECVCTQEKANASSGGRASQKKKTGTKPPSIGGMKQVPIKVNFERNCDLCKKHGGAHTAHNTKDCCRYKKDRMVKANFHAGKKAGKRPYPAKQSFTQLSKKLDKLENKP
jgi:hypothetical protein